MKWDTDEKLLPLVVLFVYASYDRPYTRELINIDATPKLTSLFVQVSTNE